MARTEYKMIIVVKMEKSAPLYTTNLPPGFVSLQSISHKAAVASLSLSLSLFVTNLAASRPPAEREDVHRFSVRWR